MQLLLVLLIPLALFFVLVVLPQRAQMRRQQALQRSLAVGQEIMTTSGIFGTIVALADDTAELTIAPATSIRIARGAIGRIVTIDDELDGTGGAGDDEEPRP